MNKPTFNKQTENIMKKTLFGIIQGIVLLSATLLYGADEFIYFRSPSQVRVQYQAKRPEAKSWTMYTAILSNAGSESMMKNQLMQRHPGYIVRILSASAGKNVQVSVRYQIRRNNSSWTTASSILNNALTESMARNQISARYPGAEVRILSMVFRENPPAGMPVPKREGENAPPYRRP